MSNILFLHELNKLEPISNNNSSLGGIETVTISLAENLAARSHNVFIASHLDNQTSSNNVNWLSLKKLEDLPKLDLVISNNKASAFDFLPKLQLKNHNLRKVVWQHNPITFEKALRKKQFFACLKYKPELVLVGEAQRKTVTKMLYFKNRHVIEHGILDVFRDSKPIIKPKKNVIWVSQPQRGLLETLTLWCQKIQPSAPEAQFHVFGCTDFVKIHFSEQQIEQHSIILHAKASKSELADFYSNCRLMIYPGAHDETFCLAAAEAIISGVPVLTKGIGSLQERVKHNFDGIVEKNEEQYCKYAIKILQDDEFWQNLRNNALNNRHSLTWSDAANKWERIFL